MVPFKGFNASHGHINLVFSFRPSSLLNLHLYLYALVSFRHRSVVASSSMLCLSPHLVCLWHQHSILFPEASTMYTHGNTLLDTISWLDSSLIHRFHRIHCPSQIGSELGWSHLSPRLMSHHAFHMDTLNLSSNWREKIGLRSMFRIHPIWGAQLAPFRGLK